MAGNLSRPDKMAVNSLENKGEEQSKGDITKEDLEQAYHRNLQKVKNLDHPKKKGAFQITSVIVARSGAATEDGDSLDDLDETHTEDVSSDILDLSKTTDIEPDPSSTDEPTTPSMSIAPDDSPKECQPVVQQHLQQVGEASKVNDMSSRFKVVKIESKEPFRRGRWTCLDFIDPPTDKPEKSEKGDEAGSGNSSAASSIHYIPGIDDPSRNPLGGTIVSVEGHPIIEPQPIHPIPQQAGKLQNGEFVAPGLQGTPAGSLTTGSQSSVGQVNPGQDSTGTMQLAPGQSQSHVAQPTPIQGQQAQQSVNVNIPAQPVSSASKQVGQITSSGPSQGSVSTAGQTAVASGQVQSTAQNQSQQAPIGQSIPSQGATVGQVGTSQTGISHSQSSQNLPMQPGQNSILPSETSSQGEHSGQTRIQTTEVPVSQVKNSSPGSSSLSQPGVAEYGASGVPPSVGAVSQGQQPAVSASSKNGSVDGVGSAPAPLAGASVDTSLQPTTTSPSNETVKTTDSLAGKDQGAAAFPVESSDSKAAREAVDAVEDVEDDITAAFRKTSLAQLLPQQASQLTPPLLEMVSATMQPNSSLSREDGDESGASTVAIDNKIEQAMDLVKSHLMFAVREEVEVLKEQIKELLEKNSQLEYENSILKAAATPETLAQLNQNKPQAPTSSAS